MNLFNRNVFGYPTFNTGETAVPKTRLFNRNVFASPPLFNTGEVMGPQYHVTKYFALALDRTKEFDLER